MNEDGYISLQDALNLMDELYKEDMEEGGGIEWLETFDAKRAKNRCIKVKFEKVKEDKDEDH